MFAGNLLISYILKASIDQRSRWPETLHSTWPPTRADKFTDTKGSPADRHGTWWSWWVNLREEVGRWPSKRRKRPHLHLRLLNVMVVAHTVFFNTYVKKKTQQIGVTIVGSLQGKKVIEEIIWPWENKFNNKFILIQSSWCRGSKYVITKILKREPYGEVGYISFGTADHKARLLPPSRPAGRGHPHEQFASLWLYSAPRGQRSVTFSYDILFKVCLSSDFIVRLYLNDPCGLSAAMANSLPPTRKLSLLR